MSDRAPCPNCNAMNAASASFCGQCFTRLGPGAPPAPYGSQPSAYATPGAPAPPAPFRPAPFAPAPETTSAKPSPSAPKYVQWLVAGLSALIGFLGFQYFTSRPVTFEPDGGSYQLTYSRYWHEMEGSSAIPIPVGAVDLALESEKAGMFAISMPLPAGATPKSVPASLIKSEIEKSYSGVKNVNVVSPGEALAGTPSIMQVTADIQILAAAGQVEMIVGISPQNTMVMIGVACEQSECTKAMQEYNDIIASVEYK